MWQSLFKLCNLFGCICDSTCVTGNIEKIQRNTHTRVSDEQEREEEKHYI